MMAAHDMRILSEIASHSVGFLCLKLLERLAYTANDENK